MGWPLLVTSCAALELRPMIMCTALSYLIQQKNLAEMVLVERRSLICDFDDWVHYAQQKG